MPGWIGVAISAVGVFCALLLDPTAIIGVGDAPAAAGFAFSAILAGVAALAALLGFLSPSWSISRQAAIWGALTLATITFGTRFSDITATTLQARSPSEERVLHLDPSVTRKEPSPAESGEASEAPEASESASEGEDVSELPPASEGETASERSREGEGEAVSERRDGEGEVQAKAARIEIKAGSHGHFVTKAEIENTTITVMVDTGATKVALSYEDADRIGLKPFSLDYTIPVTTANGVVNAAPVTLRRVEIDNVMVKDVEAIVMPEGVLNGTLLGMSFLSRLSSFRVSDGTLYLEE